LYKKFIKAGEFGIVSHKRSFTDETYIKHIAGNPLMPVQMKDLSM
jgi:hypothetical protein